MTAFPPYIQKAVDLGLLKVEEGKITSCDLQAVESVTGMARLIEKIQPTTAAQVDDTTDQEAIILARVLGSPGQMAQKLWSDLRVAFGIQHGKPVPLNLWSSQTLRAIATEIDRTFMGERNVTVISRETLIAQYESLAPASRSIGFQEFSQAVSTLSSPETMELYGDGASEWATALELLRIKRVDALVKEALHDITQVRRTDSKMAETLQELQGRTMECIGMLRGSVGNQGSATSLTEIILGTDTTAGLIDEISSSEPPPRPVTTGIDAIDIDIDGGISAIPGRRGRMFALAARTGIGKTVLGAHCAASVALQGQTVLFISAELGRREITQRLVASVGVKVNPKDAPSIADFANFDCDRDTLARRTFDAMGAIQNGGGDLLIEDTWGANVLDVINIMRAVKARNPKLSFVVIDHFHCLSRHPGSPSNEAAMMEERAYKLVEAAKELDIDILSLAQMNRVGMDALSRNQAPQLDQLRGTDALSHVCHAVWVVRKHMEGEGDQKVWNKKLEIWHLKQRSGQHYWDSTTTRMKPIQGYVESGILEMDYAHCSVARDDTLVLAKGGMSDSRIKGF